ncbi:hypothetical protein GP486_001220 [Trichoglossum hirsutum]|uniref:Uncharacterized protein n=1 Tax=Trichoglossum hirsutum TaxID=265104 RepID=A0A9P8LH31_9PEZI|nr:hypothetical protein GP486_001220 [Trichoglossum hirsutum]
MGAGRQFFFPSFQIAHLGRTKFGAEQGQAKDTACGEHARLVTARMESLDPQIAHLHNAIRTTTAITIAVSDWKRDRQSQAGRRLDRSAAHSGGLVASCEQGNEPLERTQRSRLQDSSIKPLAGTQVCRRKVPEVRRQMDEDKTQLQPEAPNHSQATGK